MAVFAKEVVFGKEVCPTCLVDYHLVYDVRGYITDVSAIEKANDHPGSS